MPTVDLNCDLGEGFGRWTLADDAALLGVVSSANVACGFHAGDPTTMLRVCEWAAARGVSVGAQVGYRDLAGFGRRFIDISYDDLLADVAYQIGALQALAAAGGTAVRYVKPHGALYHATTTHQRQAEAVVDAVRRTDPGLALLGWPESLLLRAGAAAGLRVVAEAFADRGYRSDGRLVPRDRLGAVVTDPGEVAARAVSLATLGEVQADDQRPIAIAAQSICLHGDTPGAAEIATAVRQALERAGVVVRPFASP